MFFEIKIIFVRILHVIPWSNPVIGGTELFVRRLAKSMFLQGHDIFISFPNAESELFYKSEDDILIFEYFSKFKVNRNSEKFNDEILRWINFLKRENIEILHLHAFENHVLPLLEVAKNLCNVKIYFTPHIAQFTCLTGLLRQNGVVNCNGIIEDKCLDCYVNDKFGCKYKINTHIYKYAYILYRRFSNDSVNWNPVGLKLKTIKLVDDIVDRYIVLTDNYKRILASNGIRESKIFSVPYKMSENHVESNRNNESLVKCGFVGRISLEKGIGVMLNALGNIDSNQLNRKLEIHLVGRLTDDFLYFNEVMMKLCNLNCRIFYHGEMDPLGVSSLIEAMDFICVPSIVYEMSPLVIQESFDKGKPVLGSRIGGIVEYVVEGHNGMLFDVGDFQGLSNILVGLVNDEAKIKKLKHNVRRPLGMDILANDIVEIYNL